MPESLHIKFPMDRFTKWVKTLDAENTQKVSKIMINTILKLERRAKQQVRTGSGGYLKSSIHSEIRRTGVSVIAGSVYTWRDYAPYVEWGTGSKAGKYLASQPQEESSYAQDWWTRKRHIGRDAHPYLFPNYYLGIKELEAQLNDMGFDKK